MVKINGTRTRGSNANAIPPPCYGYPGKSIVTQK